MKKDILVLIFAYLTTSIYCQVDCGNPPATKTDAFCSACEGYKEYANNSGTKCTEEPCSSPPNLVSNAFCIACNPVKIVAKFDRTACIRLEMQAFCMNNPISGSYTDNWCDECANGTLANTDKSGCNPGSSNGSNNGSSGNNNNSQTASTTSGAILSIISSIFVLVSTL